MNEYKRIIKSPETRAAILNGLSFLPDSVMLKLQYKIKTGRKLNLRDPQRFTEKLQWYKMNYRNPIMYECVDKYKVREFVKRCGLGDILVPLIGRYRSVEEIEWDSFPNSFVMKTTHGGGGMNVVICQDKHKLDRYEVMKKTANGRKAFRKNSGGREWAYYGLQPGIIVEKLLVNPDNPKAGINDYKIFCYNGKPEYIVVDVDRYIGHKRNFYDIEWNNIHVISDCPASDKEIEKPQNFERMLEIAGILSKDFPFVRVDLYNVDGKIYFGELTFYPWSGYVQYYPDSFDYELGEKFVLPDFSGRGYKKYLDYNIVFIISKETLLNPTCLGVAA